MRRIIPDKDGSINIINENKLFGISAYSCQYLIDYDPENNSWCYIDMSMLTVVGPTLAEDLQIELSHNVFWEFEHVYEFNDIEEYIRYLQRGGVSDEDNSSQQ